MATVIVPLWESSTWWGLVVLDAAYLAKEVVDWVWLDMSDPDLFVPGVGAWRAGRCPAGLATTGRPG